MKHDTELAIPLPSEALASHASVVHGPGGGAEA